MLRWSDRVAARYRALPLSGQLVPLAVLGFAFAAAVIWYGHGQFHMHWQAIDAGRAERSQTFLTTGAGSLWTLLVGVESAVWFAVVAAYARIAAEPDAAGAWAWLRRWAPRAGGYALILVGFFLPLLYSNLFTTQTISDVSPLMWHGQRMVWLAVPAVVAVTCAIARLRDVEAAARNTAGDFRTRAGGFRQQQERFRLAVGVLGLMLSLNVLATGALRNAIQTDDKGPLTLEMVLAFGGIYTFLVIAFCAPVYFTLDGAGRELAAAAGRGSDAEPPAPAVVLKELETAEKWTKALDLQGDWLKALQTGLVLLSPFFAALVTLLLPSGK